MTGTLDSHCASARRDGKTLAPGAIDPEASSRAWVRFRALLRAPLVLTVTDLGLVFRLAARLRHSVFLVHGRNNPMEQHR